MARKKPSGAQRDRLALLMRAMKNGPVFARGRPIGSVAEQNKQLLVDFQWAVKIKKPGLSDQDIAELLLQDDSVRMEELLLGPCTYRNVAKDSVRRMIARIRSQIYDTGTPLRVRKRFSPKKHKPSCDSATHFRQKIISLLRGRISVRQL
jgi:hypothetical protein